MFGPYLSIQYQIQGKSTQPVEELIITTQNACSQWFYSHVHYLFNWFFTHNGNMMSSLLLIIWGIISNNPISDLKPQKPQITLHLCSTDRKQQALYWQFKQRWRYKNHTLNPFVCLDWTMRGLHTSYVISQISHLLHRQWMLHVKSICVYEWLRRLACQHIRFT